MNWRRRDRSIVLLVPHQAEPDQAAVESDPIDPADPVSAPGNTASDLATPDVGVSEDAEAPTPAEPPAESRQDAPQELTAPAPAREPEPEPIAPQEPTSPAVAGLAEVERAAVVLTILNQKGGVGKTTTTVSLGAALAEDGLSVLVVDLDPQGNATTGLGLRVQEGAPSTYRVIVEGLDAELATEATSVRGLHLLPSSLDLAGAEIELVPQFSREGRLKKALDAVRDLYDVILIDCPPSLGLLTINGLVAADQVIVPIQCEYYALEGLGQLLRTVDLVRSSLNADLELGGVLMTMYDGRTNLSQQVVDEVRAHFGEQAFRTIIPRTVRLSEAPSYGQPITVFDPSSRGARAYQRLSSELAQRLGLTTASSGRSALDRLLGTAAPSTEVAPQPSDPPVDGQSPRPLPTDLPPPPPPPPPLADAHPPEAVDEDTELEHTPGAD